MFKAHRSGQKSGNREAHTYITILQKGLSLGTEGPEVFQVFERARSGQGLPNVHQIE